MNATVVDSIAAPSSVSVWPRYPTVYEINTWVWLSELSQKYGEAVDLSSVPAAEWESIADYGFDAVWLMGVWERSAAGIRIANQNRGLLADFRKALPDFHPEDNVGSPYCVRRYVVDPHLGGPAGLAIARRELSENHDEPRAAATFSSAKQRAVAVTTATLPGTKLFHEGQFEGRKMKSPVFLSRRPSEAVDQELQSFYSELLNAVNRPVFREGEWSLCDRTGWPDNASFQNLIAWTWLKDHERRLILVNVSDCPVQARVQVRWADSGGGKWLLIDVLSGATYERDGNEMLSPGLYVELAPWKYHFFQCLRTSKT